MKRIIEWLVVRTSVYRDLLDRLHAEIRYRDSLREGHLKLSEELHNLKRDGIQTAIVVSPMHITRWQDHETMSKIFGAKVEVTYLERVESLNFTPEMVYDRLVKLLAEGITNRLNDQGQLATPD